jgi:hypothetical protein
LKKYDVVTWDQLEDWRTSNAAWDVAAHLACKATSKGNIIAIKTLREGNDTKAKWIEVAFWVQLLALASISGGVAVALVAAL